MSSASRDGSAGSRFARHWHDLVRLDDAGIADVAISDRNLASAVARHKRMFFAEKTAGGTPVDYDAVVHGHLQLVPNGEARTALAADYAHMVDDGLLLEDAERFDDVIERCASIAERATCWSGDT